MSGNRPPPGTSVTETLRDEVHELRQRIAELEAPPSATITHMPDLDRLAEKLKPPSGATKFDDGKARWDLLPQRPVRLLVDVLTFGARKYAPHGWKYVPNGRERYFAALLRHINAWREGETVDADSGIHHLAHAMCNLVFLIEFELDGVKET